MAADPKNTPKPGEPSRAQMMRVLVPAGAIAVIVILVAVVASVSGGGRKMSDGSDGSANDPDLKEVAPGVKFRDLKEGEGAPCTAGAKVKIHYTGWTTDGSVFDSSKDRGQPADFELEGLIPGWQFGIPGMKPGGIRKLVIAPEKGYGNQIKKGIPPGSTLIFEVEMINFTPILPPRPRRSPAPTDLTKLYDGTAPGDEDAGLKPIGGSGLKYRDLKEGDGPVVMEGAGVYADYIGWLHSNGKLFDSSWNEGGKPFTADLTSRGGVIAGWQKGIVGMKVGGIRKLVIPPELAYGDRQKGAIPPNSTLVFEIELLATK